MACVVRVCPGMHLGGERHYIFECPDVHDICGRHSRLFDNSHEAMRLFMWQPDQNGVASCDPSALLRGQSLFSLP